MKMKNLMFLAARKSWMSIFHGLAVFCGLQKQFTISSYQFRAIGVLLGIATVLGSFQPEFASAFPVPIGATATIKSKDTSSTLINGPAAGQPPLTVHFYKTENGDVTQFDLSVPSGASISLKDTKHKDGSLTVNTIMGDPLALLSGPITGGYGSIDITTFGVPYLFDTSYVSLTFLSGSMNAAITLPGDQLSGPDGDATYIDYTTTWTCYTPIGHFAENGHEYDIVLGEFTLNSIGRPSSFSYDLNPDLTGQIHFTQGEAYGFADGQSFAGTVTKDIDFVVITPEPATIVLLGLGGLAMMRRRRR